MNNTSIRFWIGCTSSKRMWTINSYDKSAHWWNCVLSSMCLNSGKSFFLLKFKIMYQCSEGRLSSKLTTTSGRSRIFLTPTYYRPKLFRQMHDNVRNSTERGPCLLFLTGFADDSCDLALHLWRATRFFHNSRLIRWIQRSKIYKKICKICKIYKKI